MKRIKVRVWDHIRQEYFYPINLRWWDKDGLSYRTVCTGEHEFEVFVNGKWVKDLKEVIGDFYG